MSKWSDIIAEIPLWPLPFTLVLTDEYEHLKRQFEARGECIESLTRKLNERPARVEPALPLFTSSHEEE